MDLSLTGWRDSGTRPVKHQVFTGKEFPDPPAIGENPEGETMLA